MSTDTERTITLSGDQILLLRVKGQAFSTTAGARIRLMRAGSGYSPMIAGDGQPCSDQIVLSPADLDLIERQPGGLVVADEIGTTDWTVRVAS
jgi:hypothetical protein